MIALSTHVLDTSLGTPALGVDVALYRCTGNERIEIAKDVTNVQGRIDAPFGGGLPEGDYEVEFNVGAYFEKLRTRSFYDRIAIRMHLRESRYHVPLLLSPWGYSTYRGS